MICGIQCAITHIRCLRSGHYDGVGKKRNHKRRQAYTSEADLAKTHLSMPTCFVQMVNIIFLENHTHKLYIYIAYTLESRGSKFTAMEFEFVRDSHRLFAYPKSQTTQSALSCADVGLPASGKSLFNIADLCIICIKHFNSS